MTAPAWQSGPWPDGDDNLTVARSAVLAWRKDQLQRGVDIGSQDDDDRLVDWIRASWDTEDRRMRGLKGMLQFVHAKLREYEASGFAPDMMARTLDDLRYYLARPPEDWTLKTEPPGCPTPGACSCR